MNTIWKGYSYFTRLWSNAVEYAVIPLVYRGTKDLVCEQNIRYAQGKRTVCDYYYRAKHEGKRPILIYIHGGGYVSGVKQLRKYLCANYAREGFFVMNLNYTLAPDAIFPIQFRQFFKAIELLFDNAEKYDLDTSKIVIAGESAGAYFSAYTAAISKHKELYEKLAIDFKYKDEFDVKATILLNGCFDCRTMNNKFFINMNTFVYSFFDALPKTLRTPEYAEKAALYSPLTFVDGSFPPTMLGRGTGDGLDHESLRFEALLEEKKVEHAFFLARGLNGLHGFCIASDTKEGRRCFDESMVFIKRVLGITDTAKAEAL